ncbi:MAG: LysR substrate-binding domain-containing protein [Cyanobacteria bacterium P01_A01_bin.3]
MKAVLNHLPELIAFVESVDAASFSAAARALGTTPSAISKRVAKLEDRLGVRLLQRTTRSLSLTDEGCTYYERVAHLLQDLEEANDEVMSGGKPCGQLTISVSLDFGHDVLVQLMPEFLALYPDIQVDLRLTDRCVDLVTEGIDVAVRMGDLPDSRLIRRHLGRAEFVLCASPSYLETYGVPTTPEELLQHNCLRYVYDGKPLPWEFDIDGTLQTIQVSGTLNSDNGPVLKTAALAGLGITSLFDFQVIDELKNQQLVSLFPNLMPPGLLLQAVFTHRRNLSPRVQVFLDFIAERYASIPKLTTAHS